MTEKKPPAELQAQDGENV